jgi:uncharacterized membrane protein
LHGSRIGRADVRRCDPATTSGIRRKVELTMLKQLDQVSASQRRAAISVRELSPSDIGFALRLGWRDFLRYPSFAIILALVYPLLGLLMARILHGYAFLPLLFPLAAGFALIGPFAALIFYELSRRSRTADGDHLRSAFNNVLQSPSIGSIMALSGLVAIIFVVWIAVAQSIYNSFYGFAPVASMSEFVVQTLGTGKGRTFLLESCAVGAIFATFTFGISVVSFPFLLDQKASAVDAMLVSFRVIKRNPRVMFLWGMLVAALLAIAIVPFFLGLVVVLPVLGHATWHLYRRAVS